MPLLKFATALVLLAVLLILAVQNPQPVLINFLSWRSVSSPILVLVLAGVIVGFIAGFLVGWRPVQDDEPPKDEDPPP